MLRGSHRNQKLLRSVFYKIRQQKIIIKYFFQFCQKMVLKSCLKNSLPNKLNFIKIFIKFTIFQISMGSTNISSGPIRFACLRPAAQDVTFIQFEIIDDAIRRCAKFDRLLNFCNSCQFHQNFRAHFSYGSYVQTFFVLTFQD